MSKHHEVISITNSWYEAWKIIGDNFLKFLFFTAVPLIITYAFSWSALGSFIFSINTETSLGDIFKASSGFIYFVIIAFIVIIITQIIGMIAILVTAVYNDLKISQIISKSLEFFWSFIILGILMFLITILGAIISYLIITLISIIVGFLSLTFLQQHFIDIDAITLIIDSLLFVFMAFSPYFLIETKAKPSVAIRKSYRLVKANFWPIAVRFIIVYALSSTLVFILSFIPVVGSTLGVLISIPLITVYTYVIYKNLKPKNS